jgi:hypothetical protein
MLTQLAFTVDGHVRYSSRIAATYDFLGDV